MIKTTEQPEITHQGVLDMQVCVPEDYTDEQVKEFADSANPCGTTYGWVIRKEGDKMLKDDPERQPCLGGRTGFVHIMLDA